MIKYKLTRSNRKTISIIVHKDASVEVRAPHKMKQTEIDSFVNSKQGWIEKALAKTKPIEELTYGSVFPLLGKEYKIIGHSERKIQFGENEIFVPTELDNKQIAYILNKLLKEQAKTYIPQRVKLISDRIGINYSSVMINSAKTHWGSCTKDRLHFSVYLMLADIQLIDYVIIHELCHIIHHNHSALFWAEVKKHCPEYKENRIRLNSISGYVEKLQIK